MFSTSARNTFTLVHRASVASTSVHGEDGADVRASISSTAADQSS